MSADNVDSDSVNNQTRLGGVYDDIQQEVITLNANWQLYEKMFGTEESVNLLNRLCPYAARTIQDALLDSLLLHIARLCDPAVSMRTHENASLERLSDEMAPHSQLHPGLVSLLQKICDKFKATIAPHRDKRLAHLDMASRQANYAALPTYSRAQITALIADISQFMNQIQSHFWDSPMYYDDVSVRGGGDSLIAFLRMGERLSELQVLAWKVCPESLAHEVRKHCW